MFETLASVWHLRLAFCTVYGFWLTRAVGASTEGSLRSQGFDLIRPRPVYVHVISILIW